MARLLGPDANTRHITTRGPLGTLRAAGGLTATIYADAAGTVLADIAAYQPGNPTVPGPVISGSTLTVDDATSRLPLFWFPQDGTDTLYRRVEGGPLIAVVADYDRRIDSLEAGSGSAVGEPVGDVLTVLDESGSTGWAPPLGFSRSGQTFQRGFALSGMEFSPSVVPGTAGTDFFGPTAADFAYFRSQGLTLLRFSFTWDRAQPFLNGPLDATYMGLVDTAVQYAADNDVRVLLDLHSYGRRYVGVPGGFTNDFASSAGTWSGGSVSGGKYISDPNTYFTGISGGDIRNPAAPAVGYVFTADVVVTADLTGGGNFPALDCRFMDNGAHTYYQFTFNINEGKHKWFKVINGTSTLIGSVTATITVGTAFTLVADIGQTTPGTVTYTVDGSLVASHATDPAITAGKITLHNNFTKCSIDNVTLNVNGDTSGAAASGVYRVGDPQIPLTAFADVWARIAQRYVGNATVWGYDLMNEPHDMPVPTSTGTYNSTSTVTLMMQAGINAVRAVDSTKYIVANLDEWAGWQNFVSQYGSNPSPWWTDPAGKLLIGAHYYLDSDHSGTYGTAWSQGLRDRIPTDVQPLLDWAVAHGQKVFCGEVGVPSAAGSDGDNWRTDLGTFYTLLDTYGVDATYWAGGAQYTAGTSIEPRTGGTVDYTTATSQMAVVTAHLGARIFPLPSTMGGTGLTVAGTAGNVLTSDGAQWTSSAPSGGSGSVGEWAPADFGWISWPYDPSAAAASTALPVGVVVLIRVKISAPTTITGLGGYIVTQGSVLTSGQNFVGLYSISGGTGTLVATSADLTSAWGSGGAKQMAFTAPYSAGAGTYLAAALANGTTGPAFSRGASSGSQAANTGLSSANYRYGQMLTAQTVLPSSLTLASMNNGGAYWLAPY